MTSSSISRSKRFLFTTIAAAAALAAATLVSPAGSDGALGAKAPKKPALITAHLLAINDFHGAIDPPVGSGGLVNGVPSGGVEYLATYLEDLRADAGTPNVFTVSAGDNIGATPLVSAAFHDEPTIEELNALGLDVSSVGNHEFDEGVTELRRMQNGGCHPTDGCQDGDGFAGASFPYLAANVVSKTTGNPIFPAYVIRKVDNKKIAFVGMTLKGTPSIVNPSGIQTVDFLDEAETANKYASVLRDQGVKSIVLLLHEGGLQNPPPNPTDPNGCANFDGAVKPIVAKLDPMYGIVVTGHTHRSYNCALPNSSGANSLVTSAGSNGTLVTDITFTIDRTGVLVSASANNVTVDNGVKNPDGTYQRDPQGNFIRNTALIDPEAKTIADKYRTAVAPIANRVVGKITADITRTTTPALESALGDVIADGMMAYTRSAASPNFAIMNPGGIRADLSFAFSPGGEAPGDVTFGECFTVQPFNNLVVTRSYTGAQIKNVLEQQFPGFQGATSTRVLQASKELTYTWSQSAAPGSKISNIKVNGIAMDPAATYRVTMNDFLANGGDAFTTLTVGTGQVVAPAFDVDALATYLGAGAPVAPGPRDRITMIP